MFHNQRQVLTLYPEHDLYTVGETPFTHSADELAKYVLPAAKELQTVFQFQLMDLDAPHSEKPETEVSKHEPLTYRPWKFRELKTVVNRWQTCKRDEGYWNAV